MTVKTRDEQRYPIYRPIAITRPRIRQRQSPYDLWTATGVFRLPSQGQILIV